MENMIENELTVARPLAPEDIRAGFYVAILNVVWESFPPGCDQPWRELKPLRTVWLPPPDAALVLKVREVCLPFVLTEQPGGPPRTLDIRRWRLALVSERFGVEVFKAMAGKTPEAPVAE
jgi:hypothetical protein